MNFSELTPKTRATLTSVGLDPAMVVEIIRRAINEDLDGGQDVTTVATVDVNQKSVAQFSARKAGVIAGVVIAQATLETLGISDVSVFVEDGESVKADTLLLSARGNTRELLLAERTALNFLGHLSGIATLTQQWVSEVAEYKTGIRDTRKTTPGFRFFEKWAVVIGGGANHRYGLFDMILIKDNHIKAAGGIKNAIESCVQYIESNDLKMPLIVEVKNIEEFNIAKGYKIIDRILIDNFKPNDIVELLKYNTTKKIIEASGGIMKSNIVEYAKTGINYVSLGDLTHHVNGVDISLKIM